MTQRSVSLADRTVTSAHMVEIRIDFEADSTEMAGPLVRLHVTCPQ